MNDALHRRQKFRLAMHTLYLVRDDGAGFDMAHAGDGSARSSLLGQDLVAWQPE